MSWSALTPVRASWAVAWVAALAWVVLSQSVQVIQNRTDSLATAWFLLLRGERRLERGDYVIFSPPSHCGSERPAVPYIKRVLGIPGDRVEHRDSMAWVNATPIGKIKTTSRAGAPLAPGPTGVIPRNHYFLAGDHADSHDSRYSSIGWVAADDCVLGRAYALF